MQIGTPGENWTDSEFWRGHMTYGLKRYYSEWVGLHLARDEFETVMIQYGKKLGADGPDVDRTTMLGLQAFDAGLTEVRNDCLVEGLAPILGVDKEKLQGFWFSRLACEESPFGGCLFDAEPEWGDQCVFCLHHSR